MPCVEHTCAYTPSFWFVLCCCRRREECKCDPAGESRMKTVKSLFFRRPNLLLEVRARLRLRAELGPGARFAATLEDGVKRVERVAVSAGDALTLRDVVPLEILQTFVRTSVLHLVCIFLAPAHEIDCLRGRSNTLLFPFVFPRLF